ncbi:hypothetical protein PAXRUDRAFT_17305 [Paxillus rubicundulus Ve08.2h10]|uniref:Uncharacterized protein n=1 Tax=Paxillus rubicundulus Ve08.2h10 TaxID=930991 RepID=A0A0D0CQS3_9AGAM|nr:hypothetical protein PAXRUDRAFT_17305 [Paxillus rubicundulus Ve08.2h10]
MVWEYWGCDKEMVQSFQSQLILILRMYLASPRLHILKAAESLALMEFMNWLEEAARKDIEAHLCIEAGKSEFSGLLV